MSWDGKTYEKYRIEHTDGTPLKGKKYFVLRLDSEDPVEAARVESAMRAYKGESMASDINSAVMREALDGLAIASENFIRVHNSQSYRDTMKALDKARAALAEQKHEAKWELGAEYEFACCSHCGYMQYAGWDSSQEAAENIGEFHKECKFCPNCGFEMKGESDGSK